MSNFFASLKRQDASFSDYRRLVMRGSLCKTRVSLLSVIKWSNNARIEISVDYRTFCCRCLEVFKSFSGYFMKRRK